MEDFREFYYGRDIDERLKALQSKVKSSAVARGVDGETVEELFDYVEELVDVKIEALLEFLEHGR